jgi:hypothetical protein
MPSINDIRKANPGVYGGLTDFEIVDRLSQLTGRHPDAIGYDLGVAPRNAPGAITAFKGSMGGIAEGVGQLAGDITGGALRDNALERYGREVQQRNPMDITEGASESALANLGTNLMERPGNVVGQVIGGSIGYITPGGVAKAGLGAYRGLRGIQALEAASTATRAAKATGTAAYFGLPSYAQIRTEQEKQGQNELSDILKAGIASTAVGGIETIAGPEAMLARGGVKGLGDAGKTFLRTGLKQGAMEAGEELMQNPIENWAMGQNPFSRENIDQTLAGAAAGFVGGGVMGSAMHPLMRKADEQVRTNLESRNSVDILNEQPRTNISQAQDRINSGRNLPQLGLETQPVLTVTPTGDVLTTPEQIDAWGQFGKNQKQVGVSDGEAVLVKPLSIDEAKTRKDIRLALDREFAQGNISEDQHIEATNVVDTRGKWNLSKVKENIRGIIKPADEVAVAEDQPTLAKSVKTGEGLDLAAQKTQPVGIARDATPDEVVRYKDKMAGMLRQALTEKQFQALQLTRGIRNFEDSGWKIDPETGEEMVPMSATVAGRMSNSSRQNANEHANKGLTRLHKRAFELGIPADAAERILGIQGEQAIDVGTMSEAQAAQAGLSYRREQGAPISAMSESEDLDTTAENFQPETYIAPEVGFTAPEAVMAEQAQTEGFEAPAQAAEVETPVEETVGYEQDFDLSANDYEDAKDVWEMLQAELAKNGQAVPNWEDVSAADFQKFAAATKYHLNNPQGAASMAAITKAQEAAYGTTTQPSTAGQVGTAAETKAGEPNVGNRQEAKPTTRREKPTESTASVKRSQAERPENPANAVSMKAKLKRLFFSPAKFDELITIVQNTNELPLNAVRAAKLSADDTTAQAFVWRGHVYMIADNIAQGDELAVLMHELGVHIGVMNALDIKTIRDLAGQIVEWNRNDNGSVEFQAARNAMARLTSYKKGLEEQGETIEDDLYAEEAVAYFVEEAVKLGVNPTAIGEAKAGTIQSWMKRLVDAYRAALRAIGFGRFEDLKAQDIIDFAYGVANMELTEPTAAVEATATPKFSVSPVEKTAKKISGYTAELVGDLPKPVGDAVRYAGDSVHDMAKRGLWYSMFTNDLIDFAAKYIPSARAWYDKIAAKSVDQIKHEAEVDRIAAMSDKLSREEFTRTWQLILDMTSKQVWGYKPAWKTDVTVDPEMEARYNELSDEEQELMDEVFEHGEKTIKDVQRVLDEIATAEYQALLDNAKTEEQRQEIRAQEAKYKKMFGKVLAKLEGPYAPMRRVGSHVVVGKSQRYLDAQEANDTAAMEEMRTNPDHYWVEFVDSMAEAKRIARDLSGKYASVKPSAKINFSQGQGVLPFQAFEQIRNMISEKEGDFASRLNGLVTELYLTSLAETSSRKSELRRENVKGLNADTMYKAFVSKGRADAHYIATLKNSSDVAKSFANMRKEALDKGGDAADIFIELSKRYMNSIEFNPAPVVSKIMGFNTIWSLLTKPAYYLYNATQPVLMTQPFLSQKHGYTKSGKAMTQAYKELAGIKSYIKNPMLNVNDMPEDVRRALHDLMDAGKLDITITQDLGTRIEAGQGKLSRGMAKVDRMLRNAAQKVETTNRLVTAIAAYRLAMDTEGMSHENAVKYAARAIDQTQGDYSNLNAPRLFNATSFQRLVSQFRKFQLIQISFIVRMFKDAMVGASLEERAAARRALMYVLGHHAVLAGALGLPAANIIAWAFAASGGDDEPKDLELAMRKAIEDQFLADLLTRGVPAAVFNINVSQNVGMGQAFSLMPFTDITFDRAGYGEFLRGMSGPFIGGVVPQMWEAMGKFGSGDYYQGLEGVMPSGARNALRAMREGVSGVTNTRGDELVSPEEISMGATFAKLLGFKTNDDANRQMIRGRLAEFEQFYQDRTSQLKKQYAKAYRDGDTEGMVEARDHWQEMNASKSELGFKTQPISNLLKAPMEERKRERATIGGVQVTKANKRFVQSLTEEE